MIVAATLGEVSQECEGGTEQVHGHQHKAEDDPEVGESQVEEERGHSQYLCQVKPAC